MKTCEDIHICYDGTVRDIAGRIYQLSYGRSGHDPTQVVKDKSGKSTFCNVSRLVDRINYRLSNNMSSNDIKINILTGFHGIGIKKAEKLLNNFDVDSKLDELISLVKP